DSPRVSAVDTDILHPGRGSAVRRTLHDQSNKESRMNTEVRQYRPPRIFAAILFLFALPYLYGGIKLIAVGGSYYYALAGLAIAIAAVLLWRGNRLGARLYGL